MGKKNKIKSKKVYKPSTAATIKSSLQKRSSFLPFLFLAVCITAICLSPMFKNNFTNWDDEYYVIQNALLRGPDWQGIFIQPVVSNYHPLTIITLAINYALTGLDPSSYLLFNFLLHLLNTALVFYFIWNISDKKIWPAFFTALVFGIHPMHVESVVWVAERKDVLYTLFFLLALLQYWRYLQTSRAGKYWFSFLLFIFSLLSKPAAIVFPLVLLLMDYWKGRAITRKTIIEKIPFFILSFVFGIITVKIQSHTAIAGLDFYPLTTRFFFACYVIMIYFFRFFIPYPLSAFHPYPPPDHLGVPILISPVFIIALLAFLWYQRKNKLIVFGFLFFLVNLLLILQIISIGATIVSERYTYVPYIGLTFTLSMFLYKYMKINSVRWLAPAVVTIAFGFITFQRTQVWKDSNTLWTDVIDRFPNSPVPRTNRANYNLRLAMDTAHKAEADTLYKQALEDCNVALKVRPNDIAGHEDRQNIYLNLNRDKEALADAESLIKLAPDNYRGYYTKGIVYTRLNDPEKALTNINKCLSLNPNIALALNMRGSILANNYQKYSEALSDFNKAINLDPQGNFYLNRSICYYRLGDLAKAKTDAQTAFQKGIMVPENYRKTLNF